MTDPSNAEIERRLVEAIREIRALAATLETSYVRKDVWEAQHSALRTEVKAAVKEIADDVTEIKRLREKDGDRWKQFAFALGLAILMLLIQGGITVSNFLARTGG